jgi:hypothetical protein
VARGPGFGRCPRHPRPCIHASAYRIEHNETLKQVYECLVAFAACIANNPIESMIAGAVTRLLIQLEPYKPKE